MGLEVRRPRGARASLAAAAWLVLLGGCGRSRVELSPLESDTECPAAGCDDTCVDGTFVAVGTLGALATSEDGVVWQDSADLGTSVHFDGVAWDGGQWLVRGTQGERVTSNDGKSWTLAEELADFESYDLEFHSGEFLMAASLISTGNGTLAGSSDGVGWRALVDAVSGHYFAAVTEGADARVAVAMSTYTMASPQASALYRASLGGSFSEVLHFEAGDGPVEDVAYGGGRFIAVGKRISLVSVDGRTWDRAAVESHFTSVVYAKDQFVAVGLDSAGVSTDGLTWTLRPLTPGPIAELTFAMEDVTYGACRFVAVGGPDGMYATSEDGIEWDVTAGPTHGSFLEIAFAPH